MQSLSDFSAQRASLPALRLDSSGRASISSLTRNSSSAATSAGSTPRSTNGCCRKALDLPLRRPQFPWLQHPGMTAAFDKDALTSIDANSAPATMKVTSEPDGADIYVDGALAGSTPSTLNVPAGRHKISVKQAGFQNWEREIQVLAGSEINFRATLNK